MKLHEYTTLILGNHNDENGENCSPKNTPALTGVYSDRLQSFRPEDPVIPSCDVHPDIPYALKRLYESADRIKDNQQTAALQQAFTLIILARSFPCLALCQRKEQPGHNIIYDTVTYMAAHFTEDITCIFQIN